ncbi:MAG: hypothetical protein ACJ780_21165 [Solirubrobacteraceae bacterium]
MSVAVAAAASFLTPIGTSANMMIMEPEMSIRGLREARDVHDAAVLRDVDPARTARLVVLRRRVTVRYASAGVTQ